MPNKIQDQLQIVVLHQNVYYSKEKRLNQIMFDILK